MSGTISVSRREKKKSRNWIRISFYLTSFFVHIQHWTHEIQFHLKIILESGYNVFTDQIVFYHSIRKIGSNCRKTYSILRQIEFENTIIWKYVLLLSTQIRSLKKTFWSFLSSFWQHHSLELGQSSNNISYV